MFMSIWEIIREVLQLSDGFLWDCFTGFFFYPALIYTLTHTYVQTHFLFSVIDYLLTKLKYDIH